MTIKDKLHDSGYQNGAGIVSSWDRFEIHMGPCSRSQLL